MSSSRSSTAPTCGDEALDQLIKANVISSLSTCCNHSVYGDHNLNITMANGTKIFSSSLSISKSITISQNGFSYTKEKIDESSMLAMFSAFTGHTLARRPANFTYTKKPISASSNSNKNSDETAVLESNAEEFDSVFNTLPDAVKYTLDTRLKPRVPEIAATQSGNKKIPIVFL